MVEPFVAILVPAVGGVLLLMAVACRVSGQCRRVTAHARTIREANRISERRRRQLLGEDSDVGIMPVPNASGSSV